MPNKVRGPRADSPSGKDTPGGIPIIEGKDTGGEEAPQAEQKECREWHDRVRSADQSYLEWARKFRCAQIEGWYENVQWPETLLTGDPRTEPYTINLIHSNIETRIPILYFFRPKMNARPRPARADESLSNITERAQLQEDTVNTFVNDPRTGYLTETTLAVRDIFSRFGVVECGYSADFVDNPDADKPMMQGDTPLTNSEGEPILQPKRVLNRANPSPELFYIKHIEASRFRVALHTPANIMRGDWCGYYEWHYISDLKKDKTLSRTSRLKPQGRLADDLRGTDMDAERERYGLDANLPSRRGMVKIWKLWNIRTRERFIIPDQQRFYLLRPTPYKVFPFPILKIVERRYGFYPYPIATTWISPQAEYNEGRESDRVHRRRFHRRFQAPEGSVADGELQKLETGTDGTLIFTKVEHAIRPIEDAPLDPAVARATAASLFDFQQVSQTGANQRNVSTGSTATEANIVDSRAQIGENYQRQKVAQWHAAIGRTLLLLIRHHASAKFWVERNVDLLQPEAMSEAQRVLATWKEITAEQLGDISLDIEVDMEELSPINEASERQDWTAVLGLLGGAAGPNLMLLLASSDAFLKKTLKMYGVRSDRDVADIRNAIRVALTAQGLQQALDMAKAMPGVMSRGTGEGDPASALDAPPQGATPAPTPSNGQTQAQLTAQSGGTGTFQ